MSARDEHDSGPRQEIARLREKAGAAIRDAWSALRNLLRYAFIAAYYIQWSVKERGRAWLRYGAVSFFLISTFFLGLETFMEVAGKKTLEKLVHEFAQFRWHFVLVFFFAVIVLIVHSIREYRHRRTDFNVAIMLWKLFEKREGFQGDKEVAGHILPEFARALEKVAASGACIWTADETNVLRVQPGFSYPAGADVLQILQTNTGIASVALNRKQPCYVPRLYFPLNWASWSDKPLLKLFARPFRHGFRFATGTTPSGEFDITQTFIEVDKVEPQSGTRFGPFKSFVAVPLVTHADAVLGVLCLHFKRTDPLDRLHVKIASMLGVIAADELARLGVVRAAVNGGNG